MSTTHDDSLLLGPEMDPCRPARSLGTTKETHSTRTRRARALRRRRYDHLQVFRTVDHRRARLFRRPAIRNRHVVDERRQRRGRAARRRPALPHRDQPRGRSRSVESAAARLLPDRGSVAVGRDQDHASSIVHNNGYSCSRAAAIGNAVVVGEQNVFPAPAPSTMSGFGESSSRRGMLISSCCP